LGIAQILGQSVTNPPITREQLTAALYAKTRQRPSSATLIADVIRAHGLHDVIAGRHDSRPVTFAKSFELIFGERLK
jgi:hypothetical protein